MDYPLVEMDHFDKIKKIRPLYYLDYNRNKSKHFYLKLMAGNTMVVIIWKTERPILPITTGFPKIWLRSEGIVNFQLW